MQHHTRSGAAKFSIGMGDVWHETSIVTTEPHCKGLTEMLKSMANKTPFNFFAMGALVRRGLSTDATNGTPNHVCVVRNECAHHMEILGVPCQFGADVGDGSKVCDQVFAKSQDVDTCFLYMDVCSI